MFLKNIDIRIKVLFLIMVLLLSLVVVRVFYIQVFQYKKLNGLASDLWSRNLEIEADRGKILDRNGVVLADNLTTTSLVPIPNQITDKEGAVEGLAGILGVSYDEMKKHVYKKTSIERVHPEGRRLSYEVAEKISNLHLDGVYLVKEAKRNYPYKNLLSHTLGYVGIDNQGLSGLELQYDKYLTGKNGAIKYFSDAHGNKLNLTDVYVAPTSGMNINLTIDINIQKSLEREMDNIVDMFEPEMALAIVVNPKSGEILGMTSTPDFDPNNYKNYDSSVLSRNLPIWASYEPGSTFKIMTMASSVEENVIDIFNDHFYDSGKVNVDGSILKCWKAGGHGDQTFMEVLQNSCNPGFVRLGQLLGKERLFSYINKFGFGEKTGVDLNGEGKGILFPLSRVGNVELATSAFGQGISVTPLQQVMAVSSVVNGGYLYTPYVVKNISDNTNTVVKEYHKILKRKVISSKTSAIMRVALENVVAKGGGKSAFIEGYRIGGKTGTAQKSQNGVYLSNNYIMSFMSVVPANNPEAVLYLAIDNPKHTAMLSSYTTTPIARRILLDIIEALDIEKQDGEIEKDLEWNDKITYEVPNVVGKSYSESKKLLVNFEIVTEGDGEKVLEQSPSAGEVIEDRSKVRLYLK
ncbi:MAG: PASTA domain-containing protein [Bacilli bacterium]|nr:PASTA domain-containing protein [Bacilli bacterium]